jgi:hypothetical protein
MDIKLLNREIFEKSYLLKQMEEDAFYYGFLGKHALSSSSLKTILKSWDDYLLEISGLAKPIPVQALRDGRLVHLAVLEPHRLKDLTIIDSTKGSKLFKEAVELKSEAEVYTSRELEKCLKIASYVDKSFDSFLILDGSEKEVPEIMTYRGLPFRGKADCLTEDAVVDLKTTSDINRFESSIDNFGYDLQGALYLKLFNRDRFSFIVVDKTTGEVAVRELSPEELLRGEQKLEKAIDIFKKNTNEKKDN